MCSTTKSAYNQFQIITVILLTMLPMLALIVLMCSSVKGVIISQQLSYVRVPACRLIFVNYGILPMSPLARYTATINESKCSTLVGMLFQQPQAYVWVPAYRFFYGIYGKMTISSLMHLMDVSDFLKCPMSNDSFFSCPITYVRAPVFRPYYGIYGNMILTWFAHPSQQDIMVPLCGLNPTPTFCPFNGTYVNNLFIVAQILWYKFLIVVTVQGKYLYTQSTLITNPVMNVTLVTCKPHTQLCDYPMHVSMVASGYLYGIYGYLETSQFIRWNCYITGVYSYVYNLLARYMTYNDISVIVSLIITRHLWYYTTYDTLLVQTGARLGFFLVYEILIPPVCLSRDTHLRNYLPSAYCIPRSVCILRVRPTTSIRYSPICHSPLTTDGKYRLVVPVVFSLCHTGSACVWRVQIFALLWYLAGCISPHRSFSLATPNLIPGASCKYFLCVWVSTRTRTIVRPEYLLIFGIGCLFSKYDWATHP